MHMTIRYYRARSHFTISFILLFLSLSLSWWQLRMHIFLFRSSHTNNKISPVRDRDRQRCRLVHLCYKLWQSLLIDYRSIDSFFLSYVKETQFHFVCDRCSLYSKYRKTICWKVTILQIANREDILFGWSLTPTRFCPR